MRHPLTALSLLLLGALSACGPSFYHPTPKGFVELEGDHQYDYRAVTADGLVLAVRALDHEPKGELSFWSEAIANQMRQRAGYALLGQSDVETARGLKGKQLRFGHDEGQTPYLYYVTVFVTGDQIFLLEAGGTKQQVQDHGAQIAWAIKNFRVK